MNKAILYCLNSQQIPNEFIKSCLDLCQKYYIKSSNSTQLDKNQRALSINLESASAFDWSNLRKLINSSAQTYRIDTALIETSHEKLPIKLAVFDMDSTLIAAEVIDEMAVAFGIGDKIKIITEKAMNGELNFDQALKERVSLLKGLKKSQMHDLWKNIKPTPTTPEFIQNLKSQGIKTAVVSGGFSFFAQNLKQQLGLDYAFANELEFVGDELTGRISGEIVNAQKKADLMEYIASKEGILLNQVMAVGDGANDLLMLNRAGLGVAYHAKEIVKKSTPIHLNFNPMNSLMYYLGFSGNYF